MAEVARFIGRGERYAADTCEPLKSAQRRGAVVVDALGRGAYPGDRMPAGWVPEVRSVGVWDARRPQRWGLDPHRNEGIEFTFLSRGRLDFEVDSRRHPLRRGHLTVTRPWQVHRVGGPFVTPSRLHWLILDVGIRRPHQPWNWPDWIVCSRPDLDRLTRLLQHNETPVWPGNRRIGECFERLSAVCRRPHPPHAASRLALLINDLLVEVLDLLDRRNIRLDESLTHVRRTIGLFLADLTARPGEPWTLDSMAEHCGLRRSRFAHYVLEITGETPVEHLTACRIAAARRLLREDPGRPVTDIAFACGFQSSQYFANVFRRRSGMTPLAWRRSTPTSTAGARVKDLPLEVSERRRGPSDAGCGDGGAEF
jgi:AraC family L-rhamnose operon regulatory protein RhaS